MLNQILNRFRGQVRLRVEAAFPERVLNLCGARDLSFWDLEWESPTAFTCRLSRRDYHALRRAARHLDCTITPIRREGVPYFLGRFRKRYALVAGLILCAAGLSLGTLFIWDFTVEGNETVPTEEILRSLEKNGVRRGAWGLSVNGEDIRNHLLLEIPELSWAAVNVSGCRADVQVRERRPAPELLDRKTPCNITARRGGLVLEIQTAGGVPQVLREMSVTEGQLLISGVEDTGTFGTRFTAGLGRVEGRTWYTLTANVSLTGKEKRYTGKKKHLHSLIFGSRRIKFFANSSIDSVQCDKITTRTPVSLLGMTLPVTWETETVRPYETAEVTLPQQRRQEETGAALEAYLHSLVDPYGEVTASQVTSRLRGDVLTVTLTAECREEIGKTVPIYTTNEPDGGSG